MSDAVVSIGLVWLEHGRGPGAAHGSRVPARRVPTWWRPWLTGTPLVLAPGQRGVVPCGFCMALPRGL